eukprot:18867-Pyramimonas_sp.AAC.1
MVEWDRDPDTTVLCANTTANVALEELKRAITPWLEEANIEADKWKVIGPSPSRRYVIQFAGDVGAAPRRAAHARRALRKNGEWKSFEAKTIENGTSRVFVGCDKSAKQARTEIQTELVAQLLRDAYPGLRHRFDRSKGIAFLDGVPCVQIQTGLQKHQPSSLRWNYNV